MPHRLMRPFAAAAALSAASLAYADGWKAFRDPSVQDFGHQWSKVGDPHNTPYVYDDPSPSVPPVNKGRVHYKHRIMTREVTVGEWFEFVQVYRHYIHPQSANTPGFTGSLIHFDGFAGGVPQYHILGDNHDVPVAVSWRYAARFTNWLHNDKADEASAFESGVYDTSTFGQAQNDQGINYITDQQARSEGARYFIPTFDEWTKAGHWDPNRYGEGDGGWWLYPTTSDTVPVTGHPDFGGETNGGPFPPGQTRPLDAGSYPDVQSPWGLLDVSGGAHEWMEDVGGFVGVGMPQQRLIAGSSIYNPGPLPEFLDYVGRFSRVSPTQLSGVRLASVIPAPGSVVMLVMGFSCSQRRRR